MFPLSHNGISDYHCTFRQINFTMHDNDVFILAFLCWLSLMHFFVTLLLSLCFLSTPLLDFTLTEILLSLFSSEAARLSSWSFCFQFNLVVFLALHFSVFGLCFSFFILQGLLRSNIYFHYLQQVGGRVNKVFIYEMFSLMSCGCD